MQKHIVLTGHIVDHLNTIVAKASWDKMSEDERRIFGEVAQEAAARATKIIQKQEAEAIDFFKAQGLTVTEIDRADFEANVKKNTTLEQFGYRKADYDAIQAVK